MFFVLFCVFPVKLFEKDQKTIHIKRTFHPFCNTVLRDTCQCGIILRTRSDQDQMLVLLDHEILQINQRIRILV